MITFAFTNGPLRAAIMLLWPGMQMGLTPLAYTNVISCQRQNHQIKVGLGWALKGQFTQK